MVGRLARQNAVEARIVRYLDLPAERANASPMAGSTRSLQQSHPNSIIGYCVRSLVAEECIYSTYSRNSDPKRW
jgi:hypothetical protein